MFKNTVKWSFIALPIVISLAYSMAQVRPITPQSFQDIALRHNIHYKQKIEVPKSTYAEKAKKRSLFTNLYISHKKGNPNHFKYHSWGKEISLNEVVSMIEEFKKIKPTSIRSHLLVQIAIDKDIKMKNVYPLFDRIRYSELYKIGLATIKESNNPRPRYYVEFPNQLQIRLSFKYHNLKKLVQLIKVNPKISNDELENRFSTLEELYVPDGLDIFSFPTNEIHILSNRQFEINGIKIQANDLLNSIKDLMSKNDEISFHLNVDDDATYGDYFFVWHELKRARHIFRNEIAIKKYKKEFYFLSYDQQKEIRANSFLGVREAYNDSEKFLYDFFSKKNELPTYN